MYCYDQNTWGVFIKILAVSQRDTGIVCCWIGYWLLLMIICACVACCSLPFITATADGPKHIDTNLTRAKFEELCSDLLDRYAFYTHYHPLLL
jgi:hypothetical protein